MVIVTGYQQSIDSEIETEDKIDTAEIVMWF